MISLGLGTVIAGNGSSFGGFSAEYQAILSRATALGYTLPSATQQAKQNQLILALKSASVWDKLDVFYMFANNGSKEFALINWKIPSSNLGTIVGSNLTFNANGFLGGASSFINTNYNPATQATNLSLTNASFGVWKYLNDNTTNRYMCGNNVGTAYIIGESATSYNSRIFTTAQLGASAPNQALGLLYLTRGGLSGTSGNTAWTVNGSSTGYSPAGTVAISSANFTAFAFSPTGAANVYLGGLSCFFAGANLINEAVDFYNAMNTYMSNL